MRFQRMGLDRFYESAKRGNPYRGYGMNYREVYKANATNGKRLCAIDKMLHEFIEEYERFIFDNSTFEVKDDIIIAKVPEFKEMTAKCKDI